MCYGACYLLLACLSTCYAVVDHIGFIYTLWHKHKASDVFEAKLLKTGGIWRILINADYTFEIQQVIVVCVYCMHIAKVIQCWFRVPVRGREINHCKSVVASWLYLRKGQRGHIIHIFSKWKSTFHPSDTTLGFALVAKWFLSVCSPVLDTVFF